LSSTISEASREIARFIRAASIIRDFSTNLISSAIALGKS